MAWVQLQILLSMTTFVGFYVAMMFVFCWKLAQTMQACTTSWATINSLPCFTTQLHDQAYQDKV